MCMYNLAHTLFERNQSQPGRPAYTDDQETITYSQLEYRSRCFAQWLINHGVTPGDRIGIYLYDRISTVVAFLGTVYAGGIAVMSNPRGKDDNIIYQIDHTTPALVFAEPDRYFHMETLSNHPLWNIDTAMQEADSTLPATTPAVTQVYNTAFMLWTSGTTGHSKAVMHSHHNAAVQSHSLGKMTLGIQSPDRIYSTAKLFFAYGIINSLFNTIWAGAHALLDPDMALPARVRRNIESFSPSYFFSVPVVYAQLGFRSEIGAVDAMCVSAGDRLPQPVVDQWEKVTGQTIYNCLGTTECLTAFSFNYHGGCSIGEPIPGYDMQVVDEHGNAMTSGVGRLQVNAPSMGSGYWRDEEWTKQTFTDWIATGDMAWCDARGQYHHVGRVGDIIKIAGQFVNPGELEETLTQYPGVEQAAVISRPNETGVEQIEAYVVPVLNRTLDALVLKQWMNRHHERHACPRKIHIVSELPRTDTGKIQRFRLRQAG